MNAREGSSRLDKTIETIVDTTCRFGGKDATSYLEAYQAEMVMRDIPKDKRLDGFPRVATPGIHVEVLDVRIGCRTWGEFEGRLLEKYKYEDSLRLSKREFMDWVDRSGKERNASTLLQEFERRFSLLSVLDRTVLDMSQVLLFVRSVNALVRKSVDPLLETNDGLTADWAVVERVCGRFDKRREWGADTKAGNPVLARDKLDLDRRGQRRPVTGSAQG